MKFLKNPKILIAAGLTLAALAVGIVLVCRTPSREVTRTELDQLLQAKNLSDLQVTPTVYAGVYHVASIRRSA